MNISVILPQLFKNDNHESYVVMWKYIYRILSGKSRTQNYIYTAIITVLKCMLIVNICYCRLIVEHYFLKFLDIPYGSVTKKFIVMFPL